MSGEPSSCVDTHVGFTWLTIWINVDYVNMVLKGTKRNCLLSHIWSYTPTPLSMRETQYGSGGWKWSSLHAHFFLSHTMGSPFKSKWEFAMDIATLMPHCRC